PAASRRAGDGHPVLPRHARPEPLRGGCARGPRVPPAGRRAGLSAREHQSTEGAARMEMRTGRAPAKIAAAAAVVAVAVGLSACRRDGTPGDAAEQVYVAPGDYDEFYAFLSGGFDGNMTVHGLPSTRVLKIVPVFSQFPANGYGYTEETRNLLNTTFGYIPWDDLHHVVLSMTDGVPDGRWIFGNANNTPRVARVDLTTFRTTEIVQIPNSAGNHASPFVTENTEYMVTGTRFSVPIPQRDLPIPSYGDDFRGTISFVRADRPGQMEVAFQLLVPPFNYDLGRAGDRKSTRLNSSHVKISYAVFCLKKK